MNVRKVVLIAKTQAKSISYIKDGSIYRDKNGSYFVAMQGNHGHDMFDVFERDGKPCLRCNRQSAPTLRSPAEASAQGYELVEAGDGYGIELA